jgi:hypothetical protein
LRDKQNYKIYRVGKLSSVSFLVDRKKDEIMLNRINLPPSLDDAILGLGDMGESGGLLVVLQTLPTSSAKFLFFFKKLNQY